MSCTARRVARQQDVDVAAPDQVAEIADATRVDDHGPTTNAIRPPASSPREPLRNPVDAGLDVALRRDLAGHEREAMPVPLAELGDHSDAVKETDDGIAGAQVAQLAARARPPSMTMAASIRWRSTSSRFPPVRTQVRWLLVE